jgi:pyroglutamyl-peptidase
MSATFLVTGFEPFGVHRTNSSWDALQLLKPTWPADIAVLRLPVDYLLAHERLRRALVELQPRAVLCTGLAAGEVFRIEQRARRPTALAAEPGRAESRGRWPWEEMRRALQVASVRVVDSEDAGQYVCESTYWSLLSYEGPSPPVFAAFLHIPPVSEQITLLDIARAVDLVVGERRADLLRSQGLDEAPQPLVSADVRLPAMPKT